MEYSEFVELSCEGQLIQATGRFSEVEKEDRKRLDTSFYSKGRTAGYTETDIAKFYAVRYEVLSVAYVRFVSDRNKYLEKGGD